MRLPHQLNGLSIEKSIVAPILIIRFEVRKLKIYWDCFTNTVKLIWSSLSIFWQKRKLNNSCSLNYICIDSHTISTLRTPRHNNEEALLPMQPQSSLYELRYINIMRKDYNKFTFNIYLSWGYLTSEMASIFRNF